MNILAVGAHPADVFDLSAGTLANFAAEGHGVYIASVTHGAMSHSQNITGKDQNQAIAEVKQVKKQECDRAANAVGAREVRYFEYDDEPFLPDRSCILDIGEYMREIRPDILLTHHPREYGHPDHPVAGDTALRAMKVAERWLVGSERAAHKIRRVYFFGTQFRGVVARLGSVVAPADFVVDISRSIEKKIQAIASFQSQNYMGARYEEQWVRERVGKLEAHFGFMNGLGYAEEFISMTPQVVSLLP